MLLPHVGNNRDVPTSCLIQILSLGLVSFGERLFIEKWSSPKLKNVTD